MQITTVSMNKIKWNFTKRQINPILHSSLPSMFATLIEKYQFYKTLYNLYQNVGKESFFQKIYTLYLLFKYLLYTCNYDVTCDTVLYRKRRNEAFNFVLLIKSHNNESALLIIDNFHYFNNLIDANGNMLDFK